MEFACLSVLLLFECLLDDLDKGIALEADFLLLCCHYSLFIVVPQQLQVEKFALLIKANGFIAAVNSSRKLKSKLYPIQTECRKNCCLTLSKNS